MLIRVIYENKRTGLVDARKLSAHIVNGDILAFRRLDGWAKIGIDPVRGFGGKYDGPNRREQTGHLAAVLTHTSSTVPPPASDY